MKPEFKIEKVGNLPVVTLPTTSLQIKTSTLTESAKVTKVTNKDELEAAVMMCRNIKQLLAVVESTRILVKDPFLNAGRKVDEIAKNFCIELETELIRLNGDTRSRQKGLITVFNEAEAERARKEEELKQQQLADDQRKADEAIAKQERIAGQANPSVKNEIKAAAAVETAVAKVQETTAAQIKPPTAVAGMKAKYITLHEVTDAAKLYTVRPEWFELVPRKSAMKAAITLETNLPGLRVWKELDTQIR